MVCAKLKLPLKSRREQGIQNLLLLELLHFWLFFFSYWFCVWGFFLWFWGFFVCLFFFVQKKTLTFKSNFKVQDSALEEQELPSSLLWHNWPTNCSSTLRRKKTKVFMNHFLQREEGIKRFLAPLSKLGRFCMRPRGRRRVQKKMEEETKDDTEQASDEDQARGLQLFLGFSLLQQEGKQWNSTQY